MQFEMPQVQDAHRKLSAFAGNWSGEEKMHPSPWDPKGGSGLGKIASRIDLDGFWLVTDYTQERDGKCTYRGHGVIGYDAAKGQYTHHWFDSMGSPVHAPALGKWVGNTLTFESVGPMGHARYVYRAEGDRKYYFRIENSQDGSNWAPMMEGWYNRT